MGIKFDRTIYNSALVVITIGFLIAVLLPFWVTKSPTPTSNDIEVMETNNCKSLTKEADVITMMRDSGISEGSTRRLLYATEVQSSPRRFVSKWKQSINDNIVNFVYKNKNKTTEEISAYINTLCSAINE